MQIDLPTYWERADALYLTATDPHGRHIRTWTWPIKTAAQFAMAIVDTTNHNQAPSAVGHEDNEYIYVSANGVEVKFSKESGLIAGVKNGKTSISFGNGPKLTTDDSKFKGITHYQDGDKHVIIAEYEGPMSQVSYSMLSSGWLKLDYAYRLMGDYDYMGITFSYPEEKVQGVKWLGKGPFRVWKNRMKGPEFAVHQKAYNNTVTGKDWDYPEFKGYHDRMFWSVIDNEEYP